MALSKERLEAITHAAEMGDAEKLRAQIKGLKRIPHGPRATSPLMRAAASNENECVKLLLPLCNPSEQDDRGRDALMIAIENDSDRCIPLLLPVSDLKGQDEDGLNALIYALIKRYATDSELAELLTGSDPKHADLRGFTALHHAANHCCHRGMAILLTRCDPNARSNRAETPLMLAAQNGCAKCLAMLAPKSDVGLKDNKGQTALQMLLGEAPQIERLLPMSIRGTAADELAPESAVHEARRAIKEFGAARMPKTAMLFEALSLRKEAGLADDPGNDRKLRDAARGAASPGLGGDAQGSARSSSSADSQEGAGRSWPARRI